MKSETKNCQNCKKDFTIDPDDFLFYEKIKVPPPTFCPECRMIRRMTWRNERSLYKIICTAPNHKENVISMFSKESLMKVYDRDYWWSDEWDVLSYGEEVNFSTPFLKQFIELMHKVPVDNLSGKNNIDSDYVNYVLNSKKCNLIAGGKNNEDCQYSNRIFYSKNSLDQYFVEKMEFCYENINCKSSHSLLFSQDSSNCINSSFLFDCKNCTNCLGCVGIRNKSYFIFNESYNKEEYLKKVNEFNLETFSGIENFKKLFKDFKNKLPHKYASLVNTVESTGDNISEGSNLINAFDVLSGGTKFCKNVAWTAGPMSEVHDGYGCGANGETCYDFVTSTENVSNIFFSSTIWGGSNIYYSFNCHSSCNNCFGCVGLRNKSYCILNRQYTKEEYEELVPKIIKQMNDMPYIDSKGRVYKYGEFFPSELSPFAYNETIAQEYFPLTKEEALSQGYKWKDKEERNYSIDIHTEDIPDSIKDIPDTDILNKVIECSHKGTCNQQCTEAFKIIPEELSFYRRMNLPLPRLCPNCRHYERLSQRNPMKLWHRGCMKEGCTNKFETSYAPERPEIVYCEKCYQQEVY